ncbi:MAG: hypothetical protein JNK33_03130 [Candidatus Doudnabacteria bacterium]|nr:hypothetical protein [Candidatus Doudnabacteria bacterium]
MQYWTNLALTTLLAVLGYLLTIGVIRPLLKFNNKKFETGILLNYFSNIITSPGANKKLADEAQQKIRWLAMELEADYLGVQFRGVFTGLKEIPSIKTMIEVKRSLVFLSNSVHRGDIDKNHSEMGKVFVKLGIKEVDVDNGIVKAMEIYKKYSKE